MFLYFLFSLLSSGQWVDSTVLSFRIGKDAKAIGRLSTAYSHQPQVVVELELELWQSVWSKESCSACPVVPSLAHGTLVAADSCAQGEGSPPQLRA